MLKTPSGLEDSITLFRRVEFNAFHFYKYDGRDFGDLELPHGHRYAVEVGVKALPGEFDKNLGMSVSLEDLDAALKRIIEPLNGNTLNDAAGFFKTHLPTTENLCLYFYKELKTCLPQMQISVIRVFEAPELWSELINPTESN